MKIKVTFLGGPLNGVQAHTDKLEQTKVLFDERQKEIYFYFKTDETSYVYDLAKSKALTPQYEDTKRAILSGTGSELNFIEGESE